MSSTWPKTRFEQIIDGTSNSLLLVECAGRPDVLVGRNVFSTTLLASNSAWAQVNRMSLQGSTPGAITRGRCMINCTNHFQPYAYHPGGANCAMADGSVRFIRESIEAETFAALCTMAGGEVAPETFRSARRI